MGISRARAWLAVAALALGPVQGDFVTFESGFEGSWNPSDALISFDHILDRRFEWETLSGITVEGITLWSETRNQTISQAVLSDAAGSIPPSNSWPSHRADTHETEQTPPGSLGRRNPQDIDNIGGGGQEVKLAFQSTANGGQVYFTERVTIPAEVLYFQAEWANSSGYSYSRFFAVSGVDVFKDRRLTVASPAHVESVPATGKDGDNIPIPFTTTAVASPEPTGVPDGSPVGEPDRPAAETASSNGGLGQGAIIGIAVGCGVVGLLLILGLVWYLLRRHRQKKAMHPVDSTYGSGNRGEELMAEKEAAADVDVAPHSPYTDEGASAGPGPSGTYPDSAAHGDAVVAGGAAAVAPPNLSHLQDPPRSFTPYSDRPSAAGTAAAAGTPSLRAPSLAQTDEARASVPSPIPGRATPRGLTTPYAHLVEEGMTEDEIRRLEEEERQLDAAIEQAGRR